MLPTNVTNNGATLNWTINNSNVTSVNLKWRQSGCSTSWNTTTLCVTMASNVSGVSFLLDTLAANTEYEWRVRKNGNCSQSPSWIDGVNFTTTAGCNSSLSQTIFPFNPNPQTGYMQNTTCSCL